MSAARVVKEARWTRKGNPQQAGEEQEGMDDYCGQKHVGPGGEK